MAKKLENKNCPFKHAKKIYYEGSEHFDLKIKKNNRLYRYGYKMMIYWAFKTKQRKNKFGGKSDFFFFVAI